MSEMAALPRHPPADGIPANSIYRLVRMDPEMNSIINARTFDKDDFGVTYDQHTDVLCISHFHSDFQAFITPTHIVVLRNNLPEKIRGVAFNESERGIWLLIKTTNNYLEVYSRSLLDTMPRIDQRVIQTMNAAITGQVDIQCAIDGQWITPPQFNFRRNQQKNSISFYLENNDRDLKIRVSPTKVTVRLDGMQQRLSGVGFNNIQGGAWVLVKTDMVLFEFYVRSHIF